MIILPCSSGLCWGLHFCFQKGFLISYYNQYLVTMRTHIAVLSARHDVPGYTKEGGGGEKRWLQEQKTMMRAPELQTQAWIHAAELLMASWPSVKSWSFSLSEWRSSSLLEKIPLGLPRILSTTVGFLVSIRLYVHLFRTTFFPSPPSTTLLFLLWIIVHQYHWSSSPFAAGGSSKLLRASHTAAANDMWWHPSSSAGDPNVFAAF